MDFFEHQDKARKHTKVLVVYFVIAVLCIIASVYIASLLIFYGVHAKQPPGAPPPELVLWDSQLFLYVVLGTLGVVIVGSLYKTAAMAKGGSAVAESLGGRPLNPNTTHPDERKLRNVIEEMAIAAGVTVPDIYVLDYEKGINAFAAGRMAKTCLWRLFTNTCHHCFSRPGTKQTSQLAASSVTGHPSLSIAINSGSRIDWAPCCPMRRSDSGSFVAFALMPVWCGHFCR